MDIEVVLQNGKSFDFKDVEPPTIEAGVLCVFSEETDEDNSCSVADFRDWSYWQEVRGSHVETKIA